MDNNQRPYRAVSVDMIGMESGSERFTHDGVVKMPPVARWRNNLTAMSQHENLFFIASGDHVAVYQPEFPYQTLKRHPALLIKPELANPHAPGYMSQYRHRAEEHCINHLIVGELGSQEVILLATDSGNIEAYYTTSILGAISDTRQNGLDNRFANALGPRPFFKHWVHQSAWGLDIHKEARMIAVSSNVPSLSQPSNDIDGFAAITVFAFALAHSPRGGSGDSEDGDDENALEADWTQWDTYRNAERPERDQNYKVVLNGKDGHTNNVPNLCFVNSSEDLGGTWLLSTDITGYMKLWQIWKGTCLRQWDFSNEDNRLGAWGAQASYPGWNVAALDVSVFRPVTTNVEFMGADRAPPHYGYHDQGPSFNLTSIARQIPENSRFHPTHPDISDAGEDSGDDELFNNQNIDEDESDADDENAMEGVQQSMAAQPSPSNSRQSRTDATDLANSRLLPLPLEFEYGEEDHESDYFSSDESSNEDDESFPVGPDPTPPPPGNRRIGEMRQKVKPYQLPDVPIPEIAMIHCSNTHLRMIGSPRARYPHIFCANVVRQSLPEHILNMRPGAELQIMDRLNMIQKIPELGVLLVATQAGRVAVCSLTRKQDLFGFRLDWVLPTKKQERSGRRPNLCTLVGMAVAPIQGRWKSCLESSDEEEERVLLNDGIVDGVETTFDPTVVVLRHRLNSKERQAQRAGRSPDPKLEKKPWRKPPRGIPAWQAVEPSTRYRIMLTYSDLSVLTYEISRNIEKRYEAE